MDDSEQLHHEAAALLCRVGEGDREAFGELYDRFSGALLALCLTMLADRAEAEDTLQEVFLTVWSKASLYDSALGKAVSWLMTVTRNRCLDRLRASKRKREGLEKAREEMGEKSQPGATLPDAAVKDTRDLVYRALHELPEKQRLAIELAFIKGYTQTEVAELLDEPLGTVKARIRRGMLRMRELLDHGTDRADSSTPTATGEEPTS